MAFGYQGIPLDLLSLFLVGLETKSYFLLIVDEFLRLNHVPEERITFGRNRLLKTLEAFASIYMYTPSFLFASSFMRSRNYERYFLSIQEQLGENLRRELIKTVPECYQERSEYPVHEIACVRYLIDIYGFEVKIGPSKEQCYDKVMKDLQIPISFAYVLDCYAFGTKHLESVVHYIPNHKAGGQRLYFDEDPNKTELKLMLGPDEAVRYVLTLASIAGNRLGKSCLTEEDRNMLYGKKLKKITRQLLLENILQPYHKVMSHG